MPTIHRENGFRFFFYAGEGNEPPHVHCRRQGGEMKIWLDSLNVQFAFAMTPKDQREVVRITKKNAKKFKECWDEFTRRKR